MNRYSRVLSAFLVLLLSGSTGGTAWCNRPEQDSATPAETDFEISDAVQASLENPFSFADPDPSRLLRNLDYTIDPAKKSVLLIAVSTELSPQQASDVQAGILGLISDSMCKPDDTLVVWDSDLRRVATIRNDDRVQDCSAKWLKFKVHQNQTELARLNQFFQAMKEAEHSGTAAWDLPRLTHHLGQEFHEWHDYSNRILVLFGSATEISSDQSLPSLKTAYPTVGTLRAELSPLSTRNKAWYLGNISTHFVYTDELTSRVLRDGLSNWMSAFFLSQGSPLLTFSADPRVSERVLNPQLPVIPAYVDDVNPGFIPVQPVRIFDEFNDGRFPSTLERGSLQIGLKWDASRKVDLDLHVGLAKGGQRLSFRNPNSRIGNLQKDLATGFEIVSLTQEIIPSEVEVWVNWYAGSAPNGVQGEVRVVYAGALHSIPVAFLQATQGNEGKIGSSHHWRKIDLRQVLAGQ